MVLFTGYCLGYGRRLNGTAFTDLGGPARWRHRTAAGVPCFITMFAAWRWLREDLTAEPICSLIRSRSYTTVVPDFRTAVPARHLHALAAFHLDAFNISYCLNSWLPTLLVEVGRDHKLAALSVSIFLLGGIIAALGVGLLIDRLGAMPTLISFLTVSSALLFCIGQYLASASPTLLLILLALCGFFVLGAYGGVNVVLATFYPAPLRATGIGWTKSVGSDRDACSAHIDRRRTERRHHGYHDHVLVCGARDRRSAVPGNNRHCDIGRIRRIDSTDAEALERASDRAKAAASLAGLGSKGGPDSQREVPSLSSQ